MLPRWRRSPRTTGCQGDDPVGSPLPLWPWLTQLSSWLPLKGNMQGWDGIYYQLSELRAHKTFISVGH